MKAAAHIFRFAVGHPQAVESWVWRLWSHKDDVYLGARDALTAFKVSLHRSGVWRIAFVEDLERNGNLDRAIVKWKRPGEFAPGWTPSIGLLVSSIRPDRPFETQPATDSRVTWFAAPDPGRKLLFKLLFSHGSLGADDLKRVITARDRLATCLVKAGGEKVWLVLRHEGLTGLEENKVRDAMSKTKIHLRPGSDADAVGARALLVVADDAPGVSNQPTILDISLGKENVTYETA